MPAVKGLPAISALFLVLTAAPQAQTLAGEWAGESKCVGNRGACVDEQNVYVIAPKTDRLVFISAYKIVNGERVLMGESDYQYDTQTHRLTWDFTANGIHRRWEFVVTATTMQGTLTVLPDQTVVRRVTLAKRAS
jgi:hypothetical protein